MKIKKEHLLATLMVVFLISTITLGFLMWAESISTLQDRRNRESDRRLIVPTPATLAGWDSATKNRAVYSTCLVGAYQAIRRDLPPAQPSPWPWHDDAAENAWERNIRPRHIDYISAHCRDRIPEQPSPAPATAFPENSRPSTGDTSRRRPPTTSTSAPWPENTR